jgi:hypothetical protein
MHVEVMSSLLNSRSTIHSVHHSDSLCYCLDVSFALQLLQQLQRLRSAAYASSPASSTAEGLLSGGSGHSDDAAACVLAQEPHAHNSFAVALEEERLDVEAMACELLALGYMVQVRDGAQQTERSKTPRSCLQNLRHRYIVCLGVREAADGEASYLPEPLVVEPRFREQFSIAHPTPEYEALLQVRTRQWGAATAAQQARTFLIAIAVRTN